MISAVVDASAAISWIVVRQQTRAARALLAESANWLFMAPHVFPYEVANQLLKLARRDGGSDQELDRDLEVLAALEIETVPVLDEAGFRRALRLARREQLSLFDACYLDLALRDALVLISRDGPLLGAAARLDVEVRDVR